MKSEYCCGCSACMLICPSGAIKMEENIEGFLYPILNSDKCIKCSKCEVVCPIGKRRQLRNPKCFIAKSTNESVVLNSSSGGVFSELAIPVLRSGGYVAGCVLEMDSRRAVHRLVDNEFDLGMLRGSKYIQSDVSEVYGDSKKLLDVGKTVLFSGTPCQIDGLKRFLGREYVNLICVEIVCHGVGSSKIFQQFILELENKYNSRAIDINFRSKQSELKKSSFVVDFENGMRYISAPYANPYGKAFLNRLCLRRSCDFCPSKLGLSGADLTIGDYWGGNVFHPQFDQKNGASVVVVWTETGEKVFNQSSLVYANSHWDWAIHYNPSLACSGNTNVKKRNLLFNRYKNDGVSRTVEKLCKRQRLILLMSCFRKIGCWLKNLKNTICHG